MKKKNVKWTKKIADAIHTIDNYSTSTVEPMWLDAGWWTDETTGTKELVFEITEPGRDNIIVSLNALFKIAKKLVKLNKVIIN